MKKIMLLLILLTVAPALETHIFAFATIPDIQLYPKKQVP